MFTGLSEATNDFIESLLVSMGNQYGYTSYDLKAKRFYEGAVITPDFKEYKGTVFVRKSESCVVVTIDRGAGSKNFFFPYDAERMFVYINGEEMRILFTNAEGFIESESWDACLRTTSNHLVLSNKCSLHIKEEQGLTYYKVTDKEGYEASLEFVLPNSVYDSNYYNNKAALIDIIKKLA